MEKETFLTHIEPLLQEPCMVLDIFPEQVPADSVHFWAVENFLRKSKTLPRYAEQIGLIIFKLLCYEDADIFLVDDSEHTPFTDYKDINLSELPLEKLATLIKTIITRDAGTLHILFHPSGTLISIEGTFQTSVYHTSDAMRHRLTALAQAHGVFFHAGAR